MALFYSSLTLWKMGDIEGTTEQERSAHLCGCLGLQDSCVCSCKANFLDRRRWRNNGERLQHGLHLAASKAGHVHCWQVRQVAHLRELWQCPVCCCILLAPAGWECELGLLVMRPRR